LSNTWIHTAVGAAVAIATVDAPPVEKAVVVGALVASHVAFDLIPHGHLVDFGFMSEGKSYIVEAWSGLLIIPLVTWYLTGCNFFWGFVCCNAPNLLDYFCFFSHYSEKWQWAEEFNLKIHPWVGKVSRRAVILCDVFVTGAAFWFLVHEVATHLKSW